MYAGQVQSQPPVRGFVTAIDDEHGRRMWTLADDLCTPQDHEPATATVPWVRVATPDNATSDALWRLAGAHAGTVGGKRLELVLVALPEEAGYRESGTGFTVLARGRMSKDGPWGAPGIGQVARAGRGDLLKRAPTLRDAHAASFLVVGGGGLGSSLGLELARIPPRAISFLDGDAVDPATSLRSPSGWRTAGLSKPHALALLATDCTPYTVIGGTGRRLGAPRTNNAALVPNQWLTAVHVFRPRVVGRTDAAPRHSSTSTRTLPGRPAGTGVRGWRRSHGSTQHHLRRHPGETQQATERRDGQRGRPHGFRTWLRQRLTDEPAG